MLTVYAIPAFKDNYFWLLQPDSGSHRAYIIDPGAAEPVIAALAEHQLELAGIIITHHHHDHIDGTNDLVERYSVPVYGPRSAKIPQVTHFLSGGDQLRLPSFTLDVLAVPGHTLDHIAYLYRPERQLDQRSGTQSITNPDEPDEPASLFCGDTLFAGGCGRLFDGTASQLYNSLMQLAKLDVSTLVYCAHEYTLANLEFARVVEPGNAFLVERLQQVSRMRAQGIMTLPSTIGLENQTNPYLRTSLAPIRQAAEERSGRSLHSPEDVFVVIRAWKDQF